MTAPAQLDGAIKALSLSDLHESPDNPRETFDVAELANLAASIAEKGVLTPLLVRPRAKGGYEIAAGHRRFRAARIAEKTLERKIKVPAFVRRLSDADFLELLVFENDHHNPPHPLEEARGFEKLMLKVEGYDVGRLATRGGRSVDYVYDRLRLLKLVPAAQRLFLQRRFTLAHAIILAKLSTDDQTRAIDPKAVDNHDGGLWANEVAPSLDLAGDTEKDPFGGLKPKSPAELQHWVNTRTYLDLTTPDAGDLFGDAVAAVLDATEAGVRVVRITLDESMVRPEAKRGDERVYGPRTWERADGEEGSKLCEFSVLGVVGPGTGRGGAFAVCVAKDRCRVHYGADIRRREKVAKASDNGAVAGKAAEKSAAEERAAENRRSERDAALRVAVLPAVLDAFGERLAALTDDALAGAVFKQFGPNQKPKKGTDAAKLAERFPGGTLADTVRRLLWVDALNDTTDHTGGINSSEWAWNGFTKRARDEFGVDVDALTAAAKKTAKDEKAPAGTK